MDSEQAKQERDKELEYWEEFMEDGICIDEETLESLRPNASCK